MLCQLSKAMFRLETLAKHDVSRCSFVANILQVPRQRERELSGGAARQHTFRTRESRNYEWEMMGSTSWYYAEYKTMDTLGPDFVEEMCNVPDNETQAAQKKEPQTLILQSPMCDRRHLTRGRRHQENQLHMMGGYHEGYIPREDRKWELLVRITMSLQPPWHGGSTAFHYLVPPLLRQSTLNQR